jgi:predicted Fe-Mo cluster-binding NifX family protein
MKVAVVSDDFETLSGKAGRARRFLVYEADRTSQPQLEKRYELPEHIPTFHDLHEDNETPHPIDGMLLLTAEAGEGFRERLQRRAITVVITSERDPEQAVIKMFDGTLPELAPTPHQEGACCE